MLEKQNVGIFFFNEFSKLYRQCLRQKAPTEEQGCRTFWQQQALGLFDNSRRCQTYRRLMLRGKEFDCFSLENESDFCSSTSFVQLSTLMARMTYVAAANFLYSSNGRIPASLQCKNILFMHEQGNPSANFQSTLKR